MDFENIKMWQREPNCLYYTKSRLKCDGCNKFVESGHHYKEPVEDFRESFGCWDCMRDFLETYLLEYNHEYVAMRMIQDVLFGKRKQTKKKTRSEMTLKKRFEVMQRDKFECVLCGNTAKESKLEVDHIKPASEGGDNEKDNLMTLCFDCNRGKGASYD